MIVAQACIYVGEVVFTALAPYFTCAASRDGEDFNFLASYRSRRDSRKSSDAHNTSIRRQVC